MKFQNKKSYHKWFSLFQEHSWLLEYSEALAELADMCKRSVHHDVVCDLISRLVFIDGDKRKKYLLDIVNKITECWALPLNETLIAAITNDNDADSAQYIVQCLKQPFQSKGYGKIRVVNNFGKCCQIDCIKNYQHIILVDEFIGTGRTMLNRISCLRNTINNYYSDGHIKSESHSIKVCVLACMEEGKKVVENEQVNLFTPILLKKGIASYYEGNQRFTAYRAILELERQLDKSRDNNYIFPCGYRKSEALYAMDEGNAVNNLFPIFWWPYVKGDIKRRTMFYRKEA